MDKMNDKSERNPTVEEVVRRVLRRPPPKEWEYLKRGKADKARRKKTQTA